MLAKYTYPVCPTASHFSHRDALLITYGDSLRRRGEKPLAVLNAFLERYIGDSFSIVHVLPFFPYSSDDGFAVCDYRQVEASLGGWREIRALSQRYRLMIDLVLNHISSRHPWFKSFLADHPKYKDLVLSLDRQTDLSAVTRPRSHPLLTRFRKKNGEDIHVWTTFSADQVDLNYGSMEVMLRMIDVLLFYVSQGATMIRLDAIAYLWKRVGTSCIHLPETYLVVQLLRRILEKANPHAWIITETNVPHLENISYFGDGTNGAHIVYNFTLPPLLLYTFLFQDLSLLNQWAETLTQPFAHTTFLNFTASHDGIGVRPLETWVQEEQLNILMDRARRNGGLVSYRSNPDGTQSPYELNVTYIDALSNPQENGTDQYLVQRFVASQAISLALPGIPALYINSLLGCRNWHAGVEKSGRARSINREKLNLSQIAAQLKDKYSTNCRVFSALNHLMQIRRQQPMFHPCAPFRILTLHPSVFAVCRGSGDQMVVALTNIGIQTQRIPALGDMLGSHCNDLISGARVSTDRLTLNAYQTCWLTPARV
jgi:sucrose phosphorylase